METECAVSWKHFPGVSGCLPLHRAGHAPGIRGHWTLFCLSWEGGFPSSGLGFLGGESQRLSAESTEMEAAFPCPSPSSVGMKWVGLPIPLSTSGFNSKVIIGPEKRSQGPGAGSQGAQVREQALEGASPSFPVCLCLPWPPAWMSPPLPLPGWGPGAVWPCLHTQAHPAPPSSIPKAQASRVAQVAAHKEGQGHSAFPRSQPHSGLRLGCNGRNTGGPEEEVWGSVLCLRAVGQSPSLAQSANIQKHKPQGLSLTGSRSGDRGG